MRSPRWSALVAVAASVFLVLAMAPTSGATGRHAPVQPRQYVTGWLPYWDDGEATASVVQHSNLFDDVSPFIFAARSATQVDLQLSAGAWANMRSQLRGAGVPIIPTVSTSMSADQFADILTSRAKMRAHVRTLVRLVAKYHLAGLDLDYESINFGSTKARGEVRHLYPRFASSLRSRLQNQGRLLSVTVAARTSATDPNWWVYDYARLGEAADRLRIMTYDYHWSGGQPGPMAPKSWVRQVLSYATDVVPPSKISFGLPAYGRDWFKKSVQGKCPGSAHASTSGTTRSMRSLAERKGVHPRWSSSGTSRTFTYVQHYRSDGRHCKAKRVVWYDDATSVARKLSLVEKFQIRGVAIWALGYESSATWNKLTSFGNRFAPRKPTVALTAPARLLFGDSATIGVQVSSTLGPSAGASLTLQQRKVGTTSWTKVGSATTDPSGSASFRVAPQTPTQWRVRSARGWALLPSATEPMTTEVAYHVHVRHTHRVVQRGSQWNLRGKATKSTPHTRALRQVRVDGKWKTQDTTQVGSDGSFRFPMHSTARGTRTFRVVAVSGQLARGASQLVRVTVN